MTAGHAVGGSVFLRKIRHRPNGVQLRLNTDGQIGTPRITISMNLLSGITGVNLNGLGEMQRDFVGERLQKRFCSIERQLVNNQVPASCRTSRQRASTLRRSARKVISPHGCSIDKGMTSSLN